MLTIDRPIYRRSADGLALEFRPSFMVVSEARTAAVEITPLRRIVRETNSFYLACPLVIEAHPRFLRIRKKQSREHYDVSYREILERAKLPNTMSYERVFTLGAQNAAERTRRERFARRHHISGGLSKSSAAVH